MKVNVLFLNIVSREIKAKEQLMGDGELSGTLPVHQTLVFLLDLINYTLEKILTQSLPLNLQNKMKIIVLTLNQD